MAQTNNSENKKNFDFIYYFFFLNKKTFLFNINTLSTAIASFSKIITGFKSISFRYSLKS